MTDPAVSRKQIAKIWATAHELGMDREMLYALVPGGSISHMTRTQAAELIGALDRLIGPESRPRLRRRRYPSGPPWRATESQHGLIRSLFVRLGWHDDPRREQGFLRKYAHVDFVEEITDRKRAIALIEALKAILARRQRADAPERQAPRHR